MSEAPDSSRGQAVDNFAAIIFRDIIPKLEDRASSQEIRKFQKPSECISLTPHKPAKPAKEGLRVGGGRWRKELGPGCMAALCLRFKSLGFGIPWFRNCCLGAVVWGWGLGI